MQFIEEVKKEEKQRLELTRNRNKVPQSQREIEDRKMEEAWAFGLQTMKMRKLWEKGT